MSSIQFKSVYCGEGSFSELAQLEGASVVLYADQGSLTMRNISQRAAAILHESGKRVRVFSDDPSLPFGSDNCFGNPCADRPDWIVAIGTEKTIERAHTIYVSNTLSDLLHPASEGNGNRLRFCAVPTDYELHSYSTELPVLSLDGGDLSADLCILDPQLSRGLLDSSEIPDALSALTQAAEAYLALEHTQRSDGFAKYAFTQIYTALHDFAHCDVRTFPEFTLLSLRKLFADSGHRGLTQSCAQILFRKFSNLGVYTPFGILCGILLPKVLAFNVSTPMIRQRCADLAAAAGRSEYRDRERIAGFLQEYEDLMAALTLPRCLKEWFSASDAAFLTQEAFSRMIPDFCTAILAHPGTASNPRLPTREELTQLLSQCYQESHTVFPLTRVSGEINC